ncbi:unnamed protein product [Brassica oleracea var. botrytis]
MATNPEAEDWLEMEGIWVERTLEEVVLVMKLACSNEVADRDDCGRTCVVDHNMRDDDPMDFGFGSPANKDKKKNSLKLLCNSSKFMKTASNSPLRSQKYSCTPNKGDPMGESELCHAFSSLEAVRKHMEAKSHCKLHYGDGDFEEDALFHVSFYKTNVIVYFTF